MFQKRLGLSNELLSALGVAILTLALFLGRFGYDYGFSDQEEFVPAVIHANDSTAFANDWFVASQAEHLNVRTPTVLLLQALTQVISLQTALALLFTFSFTGVAVAIFYLSRLMGSNLFFALGASVSALVMTPQWTIGGNDLVQSMLTPSMMAWSVALIGVVVFLKGRELSGAVLLGISAYLQPLVSIQVAAIIFSSAILSGIVHRTLNARSIAGTLLNLIVYALVAAPFILSLFLSHSSTYPPELLFDTLANLRAPHHYLFSAFPLRNLALFLFLMIVGIASLLRLDPEVLKPEIRLKMLTALGVVLGLCITGYIFTELFPTLTILKLQLFKSSVLAKSITIAAAAGAISSLPLFISNSDPSEIRVNRFFLGCSFSGIILVAILAFAAPRTLLPGRARLVDGMASLEQWVVKETPADAIFLVPPSNSRFRIKTERSIVVNFKAFPFQDDEIINWRKRLESVAGVIPNERDTGRKLEMLDDLFESKQAEDLRDLADVYHANYVIRGTPLDRRNSFFELAFVSHDGWRVYKRKANDS